MKKITFLIILMACVTGHLRAADVNVAPGTSLKTTIEGAASGDVIILADGEYAEDLSINLPAGVLTIKAANPGRAILKKVQFVAKGGVVIDDLTFDGFEDSHDGTTDSKYFFVINEATSEVKKFTMKNCYIHDFTRGVLRGTTEGAIWGDFLIENCTFANNSLANQAGYATINPQKATLEKLTVRNCTFLPCPANIFRYGDGANSGSPVILFENCTVIKNASSGAKKMIEIGSKMTEGSVNVNNCIFTGSYDDVAPNKPIDLRSLGTVTNSIIEGYSDPLTANTTAEVTSVGSVVAYDATALTMTTDPATLTGIGNLRWTLNGSGQSALRPANAQKTIRSVAYFDFLGRKINPTTQTNAAVIKRTVYTDGSVSNEKIMYKN